MLEELQHKLNYYFKNAELLNRALSRNVITSASTDEAEVLPDYEHLEFVGDRVLNLCITTLLSKLHPSWTPHQLQSFYVHYTRNTDDAALHGGPLYRIAKDLELESHLTLKPGEKLDRKGTRGKLKAGKGKTKEGLLADHMEALLGAVYLDSDHNLNKVISIVETLFK
ncbi:MAG TPA: ribonuclease III domain-containing protein, partial [Coxiellaceae bacterium]|nr:ribonuclease III domain-containing protein [Coxiellaceae bacterium]